MGKIENRSVGVGVYGNDQVRSLDAYPVLNRAGDASSDVQLWADGLAGLTDLPVRGDPTLLSQGARPAVLATQDLGEPLDQLKVLHRLETHATRHYDVRKRKLGLVRIPIGDELEHLCDNVVLRQV